MPFFANLKHHLRHLTDFSGRETRAQFWPYAITIMALMMLGTMAVMVPLMASSFSKMQQFAAANPGEARVQTSPGQYSVTVQGSHSEFMPDVSAFIIAVAVVGAIVISLLAAAVARRLHDGGRSGAWGLMPLPFLAFGFIAMPKVFADPLAGRVLILPMFLNNMLYMATIVALIVMLAGPSAVSKATTPATNSD